MNIKAFLLKIKINKSVLPVKKVITPLKIKTNENQAKKSSGLVFKVNVMTIFHQMNQITNFDFLILFFILKII
jgi:hypothetical protein